MFAQKGVIMKNHKKPKNNNKILFYYHSESRYWEEMQKTEKQQNCENLRHIFGNVQ
jgi:hypothetical protein